MAVGVPPVCAAVGTNREVVENGHNGFLASSPAEWLSQLEALIDNPTLRQSLGAAARRTVEERYSARRCAGMFAQVVRETVERRAKSG
jgi:glycosyltransferase involved in cell wall biosynthesis